MINIEEFIEGFYNNFSKAEPWTITDNLEETVLKKISLLDSAYRIEGNIAIHHSAKIDPTAVLKAPLIIGPHCFVGNGVLLRGGVILQEYVSVGSGCEVKSSIVLCNSAVAHFNFIGDSLIGRNVNFEAGAITANHYNEREMKIIFVKYHNRMIDTGVQKFGALVGDGSKIGANAVLSPGTFLQKNTIVKRLELIEQIQQQ